MLLWDKEFMRKAREFEIDILMYLRFVDDGNIATEAVEPGTRFEAGKVSILEDAVREDEGQPSDRITAKFIKSFSNSIAPMIRMEEEYPSNHPSGRMPILDLEVSIENEKIVHRFYKKSMATRKLVSAKSAFSVPKKRSILVEEGLRRLRNCSPELDWATKAFFLNKFTSDLKYSGHKEQFIRTIIRKVVFKYEADLSNHLEGVHRMYRSRTERIEMKQMNQMSNLKDTWFRKGGFTSTLIVPATPDSCLASKVKKNLDKGRQPAGTKTKVVEDGGVSSKAGIVKSNQFPRVQCDRDDCVICIQQAGRLKQIQCDKANVGYEFECSRCPTKSVYVGETSRTAFTRLSEHLGDYRSAAAAMLPAQPTVLLPGGAGYQQRKNIKSCMWEHSRDFHGGDVGPEAGIYDYKVVVAGKFDKCLPRQVDEDIRMQEYEANGALLLNTKHEYYTPKSVHPVFRQQ